MIDNKYPYMFSVAVLTYNQKDIVHTALDSILNQEHDYPYEIVIGDDCSTDGTVEILKEYQSKYPDIIHPIFNNPNMGAMKNYYNVLSHCQGKYVMDCAGDDWWMDGKVQKQISVMEEDPTVFVSYGKALMFDEEKNAYKKIVAGNGRCAFEQLLLQGNPIPSLTSCVRNDQLQSYLKTVKPYEQGWALEDLPMWLYMSKYGKIHFINSVLGVYRIREESVSHGKDMQKILHLRESQYKVREYFAQDDPVLKQKVQGVYHQIMATYSLETDNIEEFRMHAKKAENLKYTILNILSYLPFGRMAAEKVLGIK